MTREQVSSRFDTVGDGMAAVDNASARSSARYRRPRFAPRPERSQARLPHRDQVMVNAVTGQRVADEVETELVDATRRATRTGPRAVDPWERQAELRDVRQGVASAWADQAEPAGHIGGGLEFGSPAAVIEHIFGVGR